MSTSTERPCELLDSLPPLDAEAELSVLGAIVCDPGVLDIVTAIVEPSDFHNANCGRLLQVAIDLHAAGNPIDVISLRASLQASGEWENVGGEFLSEAAHVVPHAHDAAYYSGIVRADSIRRTLIRASLEIVRDCYDRTGKPLDVAGRAIQRITEATA